MLKNTNFYKLFTICLLYYAYIKNILSSRNFILYMDITNNVVKYY